MNGVTLLLSMLGLMVLVVVMSNRRDNHRQEVARIEREMSRAELRLHDLASEAFRSMLEEARSYDSDRLESFE
jgi:hypothetical protein